MPRFFNVIIDGDGGVLTIEDGVAVTATMKSGSTIDINGSLGIGATGDLTFTSGGKLSGTITLDGNLTVVAGGFISFTDAGSTLSLDNGSALQLISVASVPGIVLDSEGVTAPPGEVGYSLLDIGSTGRMYVQPGGRVDVLGDASYPGEIVLKSDALGGKLTAEVGARINLQGGVGSDSAEMLLQAGGPGGTPAILRVKGTTGGEAGEIILESGATAGGKLTVEDNAYIDVLVGGSLACHGPSGDITLADGVLTVESTADVNVEAGGTLDIKGIIHLEGDVQTLKSALVSSDAGRVVKRLTEVTTGGNKDFYIDDGAGGGEDIVYMADGVIGGTVTWTIKNSGAIKGDTMEFAVRETSGGVQALITPEFGASRGHNYVTGNPWASKWVFNGTAWVQMSESITP